MANAPKLHEWKSSSGKVRHLLDPQDQGDLERDSAIHEFVNRHAQDDAEDLAYSNYRKEHHKKAAGHHYAAMRAAQGSGEKEAAQQHQLLYDLHIKAAGHNPNEPVPDFIRNYMDDPKRDRMFRFRPHKADHYVMGDFGKSEAFGLEKAEHVQTLGEYVRRTDPNPEVLRLYHKLKPKELKSIHGHLKAAALRHIKQHGDIKEPALASHFRAAHEALLLRRSEEITDSLNKGEVILLPRATRVSRDLGEPAQVLNIRQHPGYDAHEARLRIRAAQSKRPGIFGWLDKIKKPKDGHDPLNPVAEEAAHGPTTKSEIKLEDLPAWVQLKLVSMALDKFEKNADEDTGTPDKPTCPHCGENRGVNDIDKYPGHCQCKCCHKWFAKPNQEEARQEAKKEYIKHLIVSAIEEQLMKKLPEGLVEGSAEEEKEHGLGPALSTKIAADHLVKDPKHYKKTVVDPNKIKIRDEGIRRGKLPPGAPGADKYGAGTRVDKRKQGNKQAARKWKPGKDY